MDQLLIEALRQDLLHSGFSSQAVESLLTPELSALVRRGVIHPASQQLAALPADQQTKPHVLLTRLFVLGETLSEEQLVSALPSLGLRSLALGLVSKHEGAEHEGLRAALSVTPMVSPISGDLWWILSDLDDHLRMGPASPEHVMGVGGATRSLIDAFPTTPVDRALEIGTGCGVVSLVLSEFASEVHATDISERALLLARANAALNLRTNIQFSVGDLFAPVVGQSFDLIVSNPPFVIAPDGSSEKQYTYRSSPTPGDGLLRRFVQEVPAHLAPDGTCVCLANWEFGWGGTDGVDLLADRLGPEHDVFAWFIERARQTPVEYASLWLRDGGLRESDPEFGIQLHRWVTDFQARRVSQIIFGYLKIVRSEQPTSLRYEAVHGQLGIEERFGDAWQTATRHGMAVSKFSNEQVLSQAFTRHSSVEEIRTLIPGTEDLTSIAYVRRTGIERYTSVDTVEAALLGASDGDLTIGQIATALGDLLSLDMAEHLPEILKLVRENVWKGFLEL